MRKYKWLLLDMDDTLFDYRRSEASALEMTCFEFLGLFTEEIHRKYDEVNKLGWKLFQEAKISIEELKLNRFNELIKYIDADCDISAEDMSSKYLENLGSQSFLLDGAEDLVKLLSEEGYKLSIITNGIKKNQLSRIALSGIGNYFDHVIVSEDAGLAKPHKQFFDYAHQEIKFDRNESLVIGDNLESDIQGGIDYQIDTCWFNLYNLPNATSIEPDYEAKNFVELKNLLCS